MQLHDLMTLSANRKFRNRLATNRSCLKSFWKRSEGRGENGRRQGLVPGTRTPPVSTGERDQRAGGPRPHSPRPARQRRSQGSGPGLRSGGAPGTPTRVRPELPGRLPTRSAPAPVCARHTASHVPGLPPSPSVTSPESRPSPDCCTPRASGARLPAAPRPRGAAPASPRGSTFQAMVSVMAVKIQFSSPRGVRLSFSRPGILGDMSHLRQRPSRD